MLGSSEQVICLTPSLCWCSSVLLPLTLSLGGGLGKQSCPLTSGQKKKALVGLLANVVAFVLPLVYAFSSIVIVTLSLQWFIRWDYVLVGCWVLCALSLVLSVVGPKQVRLPLLFGSLAISAFWTMIPLGVL